MRILFALLFTLSFSAIADVTVITYNMSQLKKKGVDLVACTKRRTALQVDAIFKDSGSPIFASKDFILLIQESWTKKSFLALKAAANERKLTIFPEIYNDVKNSGQMVITNLPAQEIKRTPFSRDKYAQKGIIYARLSLTNGKTIGVINVHTGYSEKTGFSEEHRRHFEEISQAMEVYKPLSDYFVVGGDFNAGPDMKYKAIKFDAAKTIWEDGIMLYMRNQSMRLLESVGATWDETNNMLVRVPPLLLRLVNKYKNGYTGWDMRDSTLDHIFVPESMIVSRHELVFNQKVKLNCGMAVISTEESVDPVTAIKTISLPEEK